MFRPKNLRDVCAAMETGAKVEIDRHTGYVTRIEKKEGIFYVTLSNQEDGEEDIVVRVAN